MDTRTNLKLISYTPEIVNGKPIYISSNCLPLKNPNFEPAGHAFHTAALKLLGIINEEESEPDDQSVSSDDKNQSYFAFSDSYNTKGKKKKSGSDANQQDHYALLGLGHLRFLATEEQIRKSYRETALKYHPDKQAALLLAEETEEAKQKKKEEIENHFKSVQVAYEVLIDSSKRRIYDSTDEFDDEIPADCAPQDFYKVFGPAFMRNGRWSVSQPVPSLGDDKTSLAEVDNFYNFWYSFKSWREFPHEDEFDLDQAESRDHKRWMERQNAKLGEKARKEEYVRIRSLVDNAYKRDPRIIRRKEEEKAEKKRKKESKFLAKKLLEEEAARIAEKERLKREEDEKLAAEAALNQKKLKEKEKKLLRKERTRLRTLSASFTYKKLLDISEDDIEKICQSLEMIQLKTLCEKLEHSTVEYEKSQLLKDAIGGGKSENNKNNAQVNGSSKQNLPNEGTKLDIKPNIILSNSERKDKPWSKEEIELLRKAMQKYPKGTSRRWEVISEYIGTERSVDEILKATKTVLLQKPDSGKAFDSFLEKRKPVQSISSPLSTRDPSDKTSESKPSLIVDESISKFDASVTLNGEVCSSSPAEDMWSDVQERALVQALKAFPKETNQRWERVAASVPGKTVNQCKKKFTTLKEKFRSKKSGVEG